MNENEQNLINKSTIEEIKNIVTEEDIEGNDDSNLVIEKNKRNLSIEKSDLTIESLLIKYTTRKTLILQPDYQRRYVMKPAVASRLIESIMLDIPLPVIYLAEEKDGSWSVIDGQQRLTSIISFCLGKFITDNKEFKLTGLKVMTELKNKTFTEISKVLQEKILNTPIRTIIIKNDSNEDIKFEIFERLNTGSTPLNEDEIRNTVFRGPLIDLLKELENDETFNKLVNKINLKNRLIYRGMILRFLAFYDKTYLKYNQSMKQFCNKFLKEQQNLDETKKTEYIEVLKKAVSLCQTVFGENSFRRLKKDEKTNNSFWTKTRINMALFDIQMWGFTLYTKEQYMKNIENINEAMIELMTTNQEFINSIEIQTSNKDVVIKRFEIWQDKLKEIITNPVYERTFPYEKRKELFEKNPMCGICGQRISIIDDAQVDHKLAWSKGGETSDENSQLAHRWCNNHKKDK